MSSDAEAN